jgi:hypothetical protein
MKRRKDVERVETDVPFQSWTTRMYSANFQIPSEWTAMHPNLTSKNFKGVIDTIVKNASRALFLSSLVLDGYARLCHDAGQLMEFKTAIRQAMVVCKEGSTFPKIELLGRAFEQLVPDLENVFGVERKAPAEVVQALWIPTQIIAFASNAMWDTTTWLYSTEAIWRHVDACLRAKFPDLTTDQRDRVLEHLQDERVDLEEVDVLVWLGSDLVHRISDLVKATKADQPKDEKVSIRDRIMSQAASLRIELLRLMEAEIGKDPEMSSRFRRFAVIPEFSARRHFVRVDKLALQDILRKMLGPLPKEEKSRKRVRLPEVQVEQVLPTQKRKKGRNTKVCKIDQEIGIAWPKETVFDVNTSQGRKAFLDAVEVVHVIKLPKSQVRKIVNLPRSWTTDGVQLHVTFEHTFKRKVMWDKDKPVPEEPLQIKQDIQSSKGDELVERPGLFRADCIKMKHLEQLAGSNLVFVDPGVANIFTGVSMPFSDWKACEGKLDQTSVKSRGLTRSQYYHMVGARQDQFKGDKFYDILDKNKRRYGWSPPEVRQAYKDLSENGSTHVGGTEQALEAAKKRIQKLAGGPVWKFVSSRTHAQLRFQRTKRKQRAMDTLVHTLAPGKDDVVVMGDWFGRRALKGEDMATPVKSFRRTLQKHRRLAIMGEYNTSCKCAACGPDLGDACEKVIHPVRQRTLSRKAWDKSVQKTQAKLARDLTSNEKEKLQFVDRKINGLSMCKEKLVARCQRVL